MGLLADVSFLSFMVVGKNMCACVCVCVCVCMCVTSATYFCFLLTRPMFWVHNFALWQNITAAPQQNSHTDITYLCNRTGCPIQLYSLLPLPSYHCSASHCPPTLTKEHQAKYLKKNNSVIILHQHFSLPGPQRGMVLLMSLPCLESQGCHLIPSLYLRSCYSA